MPRLSARTFFIYAYAVASGAANTLEIQFVPVELVQQGAVIEYEEIWRQHGSSIVSAFEEATGVALSEEVIEARVWEAISKSGRQDEPMYLRASYPEPTKKAALVHELGHRYLLELNAPNPYEDIHYPLSLLLYRVWTDIWGLDFADSQVEVEKARSKRYRRAWRWVCSLSRQERESKWKVYISGAARSFNKAVNATAKPALRSSLAAHYRAR